MSEEIGSAYIRIHSDDTGFQAELDAQVAKAVLAAEKLAKIRIKAQVESAGQTNASLADATIAANRAVEASSKAATDAQIADAKRLNDRVEQLQASRNSILQREAAVQDELNRARAAATKFDLNLEASAEKDAATARIAAAERAQREIRARSDANNELLLAAEKAVRENANKTADVRIAAEKAVTKAVKETADAEAKTVQDARNAKVAADRAYNAQTITSAKQTEAAITRAHGDALRAQHELDLAANAERAATQRAQLVPGQQSLRALPSGSRTSFNNIGADLNALEVAGTRTVDDIDRAATRAAESIQSKLGKAAKLSSAEFEKMRQEIGSAFADAALSADKSAKNIAGSGAKAAEDFLRSTRGIGGGGGDFGGLFRDIENVGKGADDAGNAFSRFNAKTKELAFNVHDLRTPLLAAGVGFGVLAAAAGVAAIAVTGLSVFGGEQLRTLKLQLSDTGLVGQDLADNIKELQDLAGQGLNFAALGRDDKSLVDLGLKAKDATDLLKGLADVFAGQGQIGTTLQASVDATTDAITKLVQGTNVTTKNISTAISSLALGVSEKDVFKELQKELGVTQKQLDKLIATGKVTGGQVARAAVTAAQNLPNSQNGLANAVATSPTQAIFALKSQVLTALTGAINNPDIAKAINGITGQLVKAIGGSLGGDTGAKLTAGLVHAINAIGQAIVPTSKFLVRLAGDLGSFFNEATTKGTAANTFFVDFGHAVESVVFIVDKLGPVLKGVAAGFDLVFKAIGEIKPAVEAFTNAFDKLGPVADILDKLGNKALQVAGLMLGLGLALNGVRVILLKFAATIVAALGPLATFIAEQVAFTAAAIAEEGILAGLATGFTLLGESILVALGPIGIIIGTIALLSIAFYEGWQNSQTFRDIVVKALQGLALAVVAPLESVIKIIQVFVKGLALAAEAATHLPFIGGKFKGVADSLNGVSDSLGDVNSSINGAIGGMSSLADAGTSAGNAVNGALSSVGDLSSQVLEGMKGSVANLSADAKIALDAINGVKGALDNIPDVTEKHLILRTIDQTNADIFAQTGSVAEGGAADAATITALLNKQSANAAASIPSINNPGSGAGSAASAAKARADSLKNALHNIIIGLDSDFKKGLIAGDAKNAEKTLNTLTENIIKAFGAAKKTPPSSLVNFLNKENKELQKLIKERDAIVKRLDAAKAASDSAIADAHTFTNITDITNSLDTLSTAAKGATTKLADLSHARVIRPGQDALNAIVGGTAGVTGAQADTKKIQDALNQRLAALTAFQNNIAILIKKGLGKTTLQQILAAGADQGGQTAQILAGASDAAIKQINATQAAIDAQAKKLGSEAGDVAATVGENVVSGIVKGLKAQKGDLVDAITELVDTIIKRVKKALAIKSPSQVMMDLFKYVGLGAALGIQHHIPHVANMAEELANAAVPNFKPIDAFELNAKANAKALDDISNSVTIGGKVVTRLHPDDVRAIADGMRAARPQREVNAPITNHFHGSQGVDPAAISAHMSRQIANGVRR